MPGVILMLITIGQSYLEYRFSRKAILDLFRSQSEILITSIAGAGEKGLIAYQSLQEQVTGKLFVLANIVGRDDRFKRVDSEYTKRFISENNIKEFMIFNKSGKPLRTYPGKSSKIPDTLFMRNYIVPLSESENNRAIPGFIDGVTSDHRLFAVLQKNPNGEIVMIGVDPDELQNKRRAFGTGSIIEDLSRNTGVHYAGIFSNGFTIAATSSFPFDQSDDWYITGSGNSDSVMTRIITLTNNDNDNESYKVYEAKGPFYVSGQYYGDIVIGMNTVVLEMLNAKLVRDVFWHSIFGLMITLVAVIGVVIWNNYRIIAERYDEIKDEVQKLEADKAIKARLASMGELAGGVAHEIRNPLNAIRVIVQRLQREFTPQADNEEYLELTNVVKRETDRINESIGQFLKMARPPALNKTRGNINDCLREVLNLFMPRASQKNIKIINDLDTLPDSNIDSTLCGQAILNILENALDAVEDNGVITVKAYSEKDYIYIEIADNGPGIADDLKSRIFDMYFTTKDTGTGMGLPSVLMTVKEHGGTVEVLDNPTGGTIFRMEFPVER